MTETRTKAGFGFWAIALLAIALLYPLSFGPACWITERTGSSAAVVSDVYQPILQAASRGPSCVGGSVMWYSRLGFGGNCFASLHLDKATGYCRWYYSEIYAYEW